MRWQAYYTQGCMAAGSGARGGCRCTSVPLRLCVPFACNSQMTASSLVNAAAVFSGQHSAGRQGRGRDRIIIRRTTARLGKKVRPRPHTSCSCSSGAEASGMCRDQSCSTMHGRVHALTSIGVAPPRPGHEAVGGVVGSLGGDVQVVQDVRLAAGTHLALVDLQGDGNDNHVVSTAGRRTT